MLKYIPILSGMLVFLLLFYSFFEVSYADFKNGINQIEDEIVDETKIEPEWLDPTVEQKNINANSSYKTKGRGEGRSLLGTYHGLTYYSQADSRWANKLYTSTNNPNQTMKSSGCGPTAAAIVVSSSIGSILPSTMADIFVKNGFRTTNNGTAWSAFPFIANYFAFNNYEYTTNINTAINYLKKGYYIIASCGNGLFTTNGHYLVLVGINGNTISIYDTYMYNGKFDIPSRKGKVSIRGNTIYCTIDNFQKYANYRAFWCFSNNRGKGSGSNNNKPIINNNVNTSINKKYTAGTYQVATNSLPLRIRKGPGTNYKIAGRLKKGSRVSINYTNDSWGHLSNNKGWIYLGYCKKVNTFNYTSGRYKVTASALRVRTGPGTNYRIKKRVYRNSIQRINYTRGNWGHLSNSSGWICLDYCRKIN